MNCQPLPPGGPITFRPGTCYSFTPHAAPWWDLSHVTAARLGWLLLALLAGSAVIYWISAWAGDRWEISCCRPRITRRWYGLHNQVIRRADAWTTDPDRYVVLAWDSDDSAVPWLKVHKLDPEYLTYWDELAEPFWAPLTDFAPYAVRRVRPYFYRCGRIWLPWLTRYPPLPVPAGFDNRTAQEINTAYYLNTAAWKPPVVFAGRPQ